MFLTAADLLRLTGRRRYKAQRERLRAMGIRYVQAASGEPLVREADLDGGDKSARNDAGPRWDRIGV